MVGYHTPFLNSWSEGLVSGKWGPGAVLILTDARTTVGSEGGPLFVATGGGNAPQWELAGMLLRSMCFWRGECVSFSLACNLGPSLRMFLGQNQRIITFGTGVNPLTGDEESYDVKRITSWPIVYINCGYTRGSGIPINGELGLILTCAHIVQKDALGIDVFWVKNSFVMTLKGKIIYKTPPGMAYDVALISVGPNSGLPSIPVSKDLPVRGERVWAIGYAMNFGSKLEKEGIMEYPLVSRGIISAVVPGNLPPLLQTTCCVQSGSSGGAIIREKDGNLLGMIVCNTAMDILPSDSDKSEVVVFPNINISIPAITLKPSLEKYYRTKDPSVLKEIHSRDEKVQRIWRLQNPEPYTSIKSKL